MVSVNTLIADKIGLARGLMTNISRRGCQLSLTRPLSPAQYLTLKVCPDDGPAIQINRGRVQWVKGKEAGIAFLSMPEQHRHELSRFCKSGAPEDLVKKLAWVPNNLQQSMLRPIW
jgi:hypothetical protein